MMKILVLASILAGLASGFKPSSRVSLSLKSSNNADMFGGSSAPATTTTTEKTVLTTSDQVDRLKDEASRLRKEAEEMEVALREEARAKGLPEEMINKLIPLRGQTVKKSDDGAVATKVEETPRTWREVRSKLGYLNSGDAVRITSELDRIKSKGFLRVWNSMDIGKATFRANDYQLKSKTGIEPAKLKLDDAGFNYQNVFIAAIGIATVLALSSSFIGGQLGFILGYLSALFPIGLVGIGSIAPGLIADTINRFKFATNEEARKKYVQMNAGRFLVGYTLGLPVSRFSTGGPSNIVDFFQIRPADKSEREVRQMFDKNKFKQSDIARSSVVCLAGSVAECIAYGEASGTNANDVNVLYELINSVDPALDPNAIQGHICWSAITAYDILKSRSTELSRLTEAFEKGLPLEECIAVIEGNKAEVEEAKQ